MEIKDCKSEDIILFFENLDELLNSLREAFENNTPTLNGERYLTNNEVSDMLHISQRTLQDWRGNGRIAYIQISGKVLYKESDVLKLLEENYYNQNINK
ncbi:helix-turn-helix domain-containing protein [Dysgonomonas sp. BGC7]|uniref:helix-turn-helix domain-containing protein n=1 Tax=Dysgonomonas sp. BGC7 TaxID=1658008 RepID=UPI00067FCF79|nr:helix-turn-helix domain-containing protein [Dysgonomonas sp. BGC7]MBD8387792.1 helix-turn-helix domain-containing protein [Dysgonomonas sp. BGC7]